MIETPRQSGRAAGSRRLLRCLLALPLVTVCISPAVSAPQEPWPSRPPNAPSTCPDALVLQPNGAGDYVFAAGAKQQVTASLDVLLYTPKRTYEFTLPALKIDQPAEMRVGIYRSTGLMIHGQPGEPYLGASLSSVGTSCEASRAIVRSTATASSIARAGSRPVDPLLTNVLKDAVPVGGAIDPEPVAGSGPPPCPAPFVEVHTNVVSVPAYPAIAREQGAVGTSLVEVRLDSSGRVTQREIHKSSGNLALDFAALQAATATTYVPEIFDCRPAGGSYLFQADFTQR